MLFPHKFFFYYARRGGIKSITYKVHTGVRCLVPQRQRLTIRTHTNLFACNLKLLQIDNIMSFPIKQRPLPPSLSLTFQRNFGGGEIFIIIIILRRAIIFVVAAASSSSYSYYYSSSIQSAGRTRWKRANNRIGRCTGGSSNTMLIDVCVL